MVNTDEKFLIDSNTFMTAARQFYSYDIVPTFWEIFDQEIVNGNIVLLDLVLDELNEGNDLLKKWVYERRDMFIQCKHKDRKVIDKYTEVMQFINDCGFYNDKGLARWADERIADPWIIAAAKAYDYTIVTFEVPASGLNENQKIGKVKIPDVAKYFKVEVINLYEMMRRLRLKI